MIFEGIKFQQKIIEYLLAAMLINNFFNPFRFFYLLAGVFILDLIISNFTKYPDLHQTFKPFWQMINIEDIEDLEPST